MLKLKLTNVSFLRFFSENKKLKVFLPKAMMLILLSLPVLMQLSCSTTEPTDDLKPGRRDYTWTVDTLIVPEGRALPSRIWGANENDVWAVGFSYLNAYCIWHYDGNSWSNYMPDKYIDPRGIWGASDNDIWIGSTDGAFWHYDGVTWNKFSEITTPNYQQFVVQSMCGRSANDIYAVGYADSIGGNTYKAILAHFNGNNWELINISTIKNSFNKILYDKASNKFLISGWIFDKPDEMVYSFDGSSLNIIYETQEGIAIYNIGESTYAVIKNTIYKYKNYNFELLVKMPTSNYAGAAYGRNEKDFFTINWDGIGHYNGTDLITIYNKWNNDWSPLGGIVFKSDVFFLWEDSYNTFVVHGELK